MAESQPPHHAHEGGATYADSQRDEPVSARPGRGPWTAVILMIVGFGLATAGFVDQSIPIGVAGGVIGLVGIILGKVFHLMETTH